MFNKSFNWPGVNVFIGLPNCAATVKVRQYASMISIRQ